MPISMTQVMDHLDVPADSNKITMVVIDKIWVTEASYFMGMFGFFLACFSLAKYLVSVNKVASLTMMPKQGCRRNMTA